MCISPGRSQGKHTSSVRLLPLLIVFLHSYEQPLRSAVGAEVNQAGRFVLGQVVDAGFDDCGLVGADGPSSALRLLVNRALDLLRLVAEIYGKSIDIIPDDNLVIDRSLNSDRFQAVTGYVAPAWPELIKKMHYHQ